MTENKEIVVPKWPYTPWLKEIDHLDKKEYAKELQELSKPKYSVVNLTTAVDLEVKGLLRLPDKVRVVYVIDIDAPFLNTALEIAQANRKYNIQCTFNPRLYHFENNETNSFIKKIARIKGQEIGYQYEEVADFKGNIAQSRKAFKKNLSFINKKFKIKTLTAHGRTIEGYHTTDIFKFRGKFKPELWENLGLRQKAAFYYFLENIDGGVYYFNESTRMTSNEYVKTLRCFKPNDIVVMLHHSEYMHKGINHRANPTIYKGLDGVKHLFPKP